MLVPVGIAYAEASGLPGIAGVYATIVTLLAVMPGGVTAAPVSFADTSMLSLGYVARLRARVDSHREMVF